MILMSFYWAILRWSTNLSNSRAVSPANPVLLQFSWKSRTRVDDCARGTSGSHWTQKTGLISIQFIIGIYLRTIIGHAFFNYERFYNTLIFFLCTWKTLAGTNFEIRRDPWGINLLFLPQIGFHWFLLNSKKSNFVLTSLIDSSQVDELLIN